MLSLKRTVFLIGAIASMMGLWLQGEPAAGPGGKPNPSNPPTQGWTVSTRIHGWMDAARPEPHTSDPDDKREILVKIYYPSEPGTSQFANLGRPAPVVLFSPGLGCSCDYYFYVISDLVKNGYVVAAVNHPYVSGDCVFPDGHVVYFNENRLPDMILGPLQAGDLSFCLNKVAELNNNDPGHVFTGKLDLSKVGAFGHSQGGIALSAAMVAENRIKAYVFHDGGVVTLPYPDNDFRFLNITAGNYSLECDLFTQKLWHSLNKEAFTVQIRDGDHASFFGSTTSYFRNIVAQYDLAFFNYCLNNGALQDVLDLQKTYSQYPSLYKPAYE